MPTSPHLTLYHLILSHLAFLHLTLPFFQVYPVSNVVRIKINNLKIAGPS